MMAIGVVQRAIPSKGDQVKTARTDGDGMAGAIRRGNEILPTRRVGAFKVMRSAVAGWLNCNRQWRKNDGFEPACKPLVQVKSPHYHRPRWDAPGWRG